MLADLARRRRIAQRNRVIDGLLVSIEGQVAAGLMDSEDTSEELQRARAALQTIGIMVSNEQEARR